MTNPQDATPKDVDALARKYAADNQNYHDTDGVPVEDVFKAGYATKFAALEAENAELKATVALDDALAEEFAEDVDAYVYGLSLDDRHCTMCLAQGFKAGHQSRNEVVAEMREALERSKLIIQRTDFSLGFVQYISNILSKYKEHRES